MAETDQSQVDTSSSTFTIPDGMSKIFIDPATLLATKAITMPPNPPDLYLVSIIFGGTITGTGTVVTLCTVSANTGQGLLGTATGAFIAGGRMFWLYRAANSKWYRLQ